MYKCSKVVKVVDAMCVVIAVISPSLKAAFHMCVCVCVVSVGAHARARARVYVCVCVCVYVLIVVISQSSKPAFV